MKDKFDLFERYSDDVVSEYICVFVGIENLDRYNRFHNYLTGDAVIEEVKEKLIEIYEYDNIYKFSNARFIIMYRLPRARLDDFDYRDKTMEKIGQDIKHIIEPDIPVNHTLDEQRKIKLSIGIASDDRLSQVNNIFSLVKLADICHHISRYEKKSAYVCTNEAFIASELEKEVLRDSIVKSIDNNEFFPYFHPIISSESKKIVGAEVLIRWHKDTYRILPPEKFLEVATDKEVIHKIDLNIIEQSFQIFKLWYEDEIIDETFKIHLNISLSSIANMDFRHISELSRKHHIKPSNVIFELQSDVFLFDDLKQRVDLIKKYGFLVAIDNFGTKDLALMSIVQAGVTDVIKIDKSLLPHGTVEPIHEKLFRAIGAFSQMLDAIIVCNGVETRKHFDFCGFCGIDIVQGYYFSKVLNEHEFKLYLEKNKNQVNIGGL